MKASKIQLLPDQVVEVCNLIAAATASLDPQLKPRILELRAEQQKLDEKIAALGGLDEIARLRREADTFLSTAQRDLEMRRVALDTREKSLSEKSQTLADREKSHAQVKSDFEKSRAESHADIAQQNAALKSLSKELSERQTRLTELEQHSASVASNLARREQALAEREAKFREAMAGA